MENTVWNQVYDPLDNLVLSAIVAALPILSFLICLTLLKMKGYFAGLVSIIVAAIVALFVYHFPFLKIVEAGILGILSSIWPVAGIILAAIFLYKITVKTGYFNIIRESITSVTADQRVQVLIIGYAFNAFLEGAAGFGAPVAISASILVGLGFSPLYAAGLCLLGNIAGGAYGAMGIPVSIPSLLTGLDPLTVSRYTSIVMPFMAFILGFLLIFIIDGVKGIRQTLPAILVGGGVFSLVQFVVLNTLGPELVDIFAPLASLIALIVLLRFWQPRVIFRIANKAEKENAGFKASPKYGMGQILFAWLPFILLTLCVTVLNLQFVKKALSQDGALSDLIMYIPIPGLHNTVIRQVPVAPGPSPMNAIFKLDLLTNTTTAIAVAILITLFLFRVKKSVIKETSRETFSELWRPILTIFTVLALANICTYAGISSTMGIALANTGKLFPFFSPFLGWIGVFLTGSVVNSGSLFAPLQAVTANQLGIDPAFLVAMNVLGGDTAKMLSPQSIAIATAAVALVGRDSELFKFTLKYSIAFLLLTGLLSLLLSLMGI